MIRRILSAAANFFKDPTEGWTRVWHDPQLGTLTMDDNAVRGARVQTSLGEVEVFISGHVVPDPNSIEEAKLFLEALRLRLQDLKDFLSREAQEKKWIYYEPYIADRYIHGIWFGKGGAAGEAMVDLGTDQAGRAWRCGFQRGRFFG